MLVQRSSGLCTCSIKDLPSCPVTASRVSCVSIYLCAIYSSSEPVRLLCKSQNSPAESYVCTLLLLVGLGSFSTSLVKPSTCSKVAQSLGVAVLAVTESVGAFVTSQISSL